MSYDESVDFVSFLILILVSLVDLVIVVSFLPFTFYLKFLLSLEKSDQSFFCKMTLIIEVNSMFL